MSISHWGMFFGWWESRDVNGIGSGSSYVVWAPKHADDMLGMW